MAAIQTTSFTTDKQDLFKTGFLEMEIPALTEGEVLFKISKYAFTTNNITYAVVGHRIGYWNFFPATEPWGIVPVWGFAEVVSSSHKGISPGERFYGYFPMSDYLKVEAVKVNEYGFSDQSAHRRELPPIYNYYQRTSADPGYSADKEDYHPIIKPLFATSFLNYHFLVEEQFFGAEQVVITSASSKTALGLAFFLKQNQGKDQKKIIGLTSSRNVAFVEQSKYYDLVVPYEEATANLPQASTTVVDMAGNADLLKRINGYLQEQLKYISLIGLTDWKSEKSFKEIPVARFFFAPSHAQKKYQEWGIAATNAKISAAMQSFIGDVEKWMKLVYIQNQNDLTELYLNMLKGKVDPSIGYIVQL